MQFLSVNIVAVVVSFMFSSQAAFGMEKYTHTTPTRPGLGSAKVLMRKLVKTKSIDPNRRTDDEGEDCDFISLDRSRPSKAKTYRKAGILKITR